MMTARIASQRVAPRPNAASRSFGGTPASASREIAEMVGSTMIASTSDGGQHSGSAQGRAEDRDPAEVSVEPVGERPDESE